MTIVCAQRVGNSVWIGSDSRVTSHTFIYPIGEDKWRAYAGHWWIGFSGTTRLATLLETNDLFVARPPKDIYDLCSSLLNTVVADGWCSSEKEQGPRHFGGVLIIVSPDLAVYEVGGRFDPTDYRDKFCAVGSGEPFAYGAAFAIDRQMPKCRTDLMFTRAVEAACAYDVGCAPPIFVKEITNVQA